MFLSAAEIFELTKRKKPSAQMRRLRAMGVDFKPDGDGKPLVLKSVVERWAGGKPAKNQEPHFHELHVAAR